MEMFYINDAVCIIFTCLRGIHVFFVSITCTKVTEIDMHYICFNFYMWVNFNIKNHWTPHAKLTPKVGRVPKVTEYFPKILLMQSLKLTQKIGHLKRNSILKTGINLLFVFGEGSRIITTLDFFCLSVMKSPMEIPMFNIHPWRLTRNLRIPSWKRKIIFQTIIFRFHVNLRGCNHYTKWKVFISPFSVFHFSSFSGRVQKPDFYENPRPPTSTAPDSLRLVLYELHIGSFTGGGSLLDAAERLIHIRDLGFLVLRKMGFVEFVWGGVICGSFLILVSCCIWVFAVCDCGLWIVCSNLLVR